MEDEKPTIQVIKTRPPAQPPPSPEIGKIEEETKQWIEDTKYAAIQQLEYECMAKIAHLSPCDYTAHNVNDINYNIHEYNLNERITQNINSSTSPIYHTRHKQPHWFTVPVPKMTKLKGYDDMDTTYKFSNYKDNETVLWQHDGLKWIPPDSTASTIHRATDEDDNNFEKDISEKWDQLVGNINISRLQSVDDEDLIHICTETIQNDTGANKAVTNNINLLYQYKNITPYPIGGVKADEVAITCTGEGLLPWETKEGDIIMVRTLYCKDVDGTIISPTTVVEQNKDVYKGFTITADCDNGKGLLTLLHRDGHHHNTIDMNKNNGLWYHKYKKSQQTTATVNHLNDACFSNLWHG